MKCLCFYRNALLEADINKLGFSSPAARKTGTTICGIVYKVREGRDECDCKRIDFIASNLSQKGDLEDQLSHKNHLSLRMVLF